MSWFPRARQVHEGRDRLARVFVVTVEDAAGAPMAADAVTFFYADEPPTTARDCESFGAGVWECGREVDGDLVVRVVRGTQEVEREVTVSADECHVQTEEITVVLDGA